MHKPPAHVTVIAKAALSPEFKNHRTPATHAVAEKLSSGEAFTTDELNRLMNLHAEYALHPVRAALLGGADAVGWALATIKAELEPEEIPLDDLSDQLQAIDQAILAALETAMNMALEASIKKLGFKIRANAQKHIKNRDSDKIKAALDGDCRAIKHNLPVAVKAMLTVDEEETVRELLGQEFADEIRRILETGDTDAMAVLAETLGVTVEELAERFDVDIAERIDTAVAMAVTLVAATAISRINNVTETQTDEDKQLVPAKIRLGVALDVMRVAGGNAAATDAGGIEVKTPDGELITPTGELAKASGFAMSTENLNAVQRVYADSGTFITIETEYKWVYQTGAEHPNPDHRGLNGKTWRTAAEGREVRTVGGIVQKPQQFTGCRCRIEETLVEVAVVADEE